MEVIIDILHYCYIYYSSVAQSSDSKHNNYKNIFRNNYKRNIIKSWYVDFFLYKIIINCSLCLDDQCRIKPNKF